MGSKRSQAVGGADRCSLDVNARAQLRRQASHEVDQPLCGSGVRLEGSDSCEPAAAFRPELLKGVSIVGAAVHKELAFTKVDQVGREVATRQAAR